MRDTLAGVALVLGLAIGAGLAWAVARTWTGEHTTFMLGGFIAFAGLLGLAAIVGAWSYGTTHGAGTGQQPIERIVEMRPRTTDPQEQRLLLDNAIRVERLREMQQRSGGGERRAVAQLPMVPDWAEEMEG